MNEHPATLRDELEKLSPDAQRLLNWVANWLVAWEWCDAQGSCDGLGSHEFRRLSAQAQAEGLAPYQTAMRLWIRLNANLPPNPNPNPKE